MDKNVLFIVYYFPPLSGAGVQRPLKFLKYLPNFGWNPAVLTTTESATYNYKDYSLLAEIPENIHVERVADFLDVLASWIAKFPGLALVLKKIRGKPSDDYGRAIRTHLLRVKYLEIPDGQIIWAISTYFRSLKLIRDHKINLIFTTSAPYSSHIIGYWLKKTINLPWVADFRDEWSDNPILEYPTKVHYLLAKKMEKQVMTYADHLVYATKPFASVLEKSFIEEGGKFSSITNGFDREDFSAIDIDSLPRDKSKFNLTHAGTFYEFPSHFFDAIDSLLSSGELTVDSFQLTIVGKFLDQFKSRSLGNNKWQEIVKYTGYLEHHQTLEELLKSDALFFVVSNRRGKLMYPGKSFEYIATGKPILACVPAGSAAADLINKTRVGKVVPPDDVIAIKSAVLEMYTAWKTGTLHIDADKKAIEGYERRNLTYELAKIFDKAIAK